MIIEKNGLKFNFREGTLDKRISGEVFGVSYKKFNFFIEDRVLDLGGNIGMFALYSYNKVKEIVSFEPDKSNIELYEKNMVDNNIKNCKVMPYAVVGNYDKERMFYLNEKNMGAHSLYIRGKRKSVVVPCMNINKILKEGNFNKIKMDIEGGEYEILTNIESFKGIEEISMEYHFFISGAKERFNTFLELLNFHYRNVDSKNTLEDYGKNWACVINCSGLIKENENIRFKVEQKRKSLFE